MNAQEFTSVLAQGGGLGDDFFKQRDSNSCVSNNGFCPDWIADNIGDYWGPFGEHVVLTIVPVAVGVAITLVLAVLAHKRRWLTGPITTITGAFYTVPSIAAFALLLPVTGRGNMTAIIALTAYTLLILFRNFTTGLREVPPDVVDAARGMGLTDNQILRRIELPLAMPTILAGIRIAFTTTVGLATLAFLAGAGGLGAKIGTGETLFFKSNVAICAFLAIALAAVGDLLILALQRVALPWRRAVVS